MCTSRTSYQFCHTIGREGEWVLCAAGSFRNLFCETPSGTRFSTANCNAAAPPFHFLEAGFGEAPLSSALSVATLQDTPKDDNFVRSPAVMWLTCLTPFCLKTECNLVESRSGLHKLVRTAPTWPACVSGCRSCLFACYIFGAILYSVSNVV